MVKSLLAFALLAAPLVSAHWYMDQMFVNGQSKGSKMQYIRKNSNSYNPAFAADVIPSNDLRCNVGATAPSETLEVKAGDKVAFKIFNNEFVEHPGPGFVYMSKAPSSVADYDGSGDWVKVFEAGLKSGASPGTDGNWILYGKDRIEFTVPTSIPDGEYLARVEHISVHQGHEGKSQFYINCAQLKVTGGGSGSPSPTVKIPGLYKTSDPGIAFNKWNNPTSYTMPGPALWQG